MDEKKDKMELLKELIVEDEKALEVLVSKIKNFMRLTKSGRPIFFIPYSSLSDEEKLSLHLIAQHLCKELGITEKESIDLKELSKRSGVRYKSASARLSEMYKQGIIEKTPSGEYYITLSGIEIIIDKIGKRLKKE
jgi:DNA-binding MarR family transcriptional regulator